MIVKDTMVVVHLAKMTLLKMSCEYFQNTIIPQVVYTEILAGKEKGSADTTLVEELVKAKRLVVKQVRNEQLLRRAREFNIQRGEAEALALYWQEGADYLASDDDSVRKKRAVLDLRLVGTPAIVLKLYKERLIDKQKFQDSVTELRKLGWFSNAVIDHLLGEGR